MLCVILVYVFAGCVFVSTLQSSCVCRPTLHRQQRIARSAKAASPVHRKRQLHTCALNVSSASPTAPENQNRGLLSQLPFLRYHELISRVCWTVFVILGARFGLLLKLPYVDTRFAGFEARSGPPAFPPLAAERICAEHILVQLPLLLAPCWNHRMSATCSVVLHSCAVCCSSKGSLSKQDAENRVAIVTHPCST